ncbi:MAG: hypothetical protein M3530_03570 [Thermoproteota archaeon]|nr:hypothetical protein [Thermoproteota archaeon]
MLSSFNIYGVMSVVNIVITPNIGKLNEEITPPSCPVFTTTRDNSSLAVAIPSPVLIVAVPV